MKGALIKSIFYDMSNVPDKESYYQLEVTQIVDVSSEYSLEDFRKNTGCAYALPVSDDVKLFMVYDPDKGIICDNTTGERVYPPLSSEEEIKRLKNEIAELTYDVDESQLTLDELKDYLIRKNKKNLEDYLFNNPMVIDGKTYTVTSDKQNQLTGMLNAYTYAQAIGVTVPLSWNETGEECTPYTFEELVALYLQMLNYVKPIVTYQQHNEILIRTATTAEEAQAIDIDFKKYGVEESEETVEETGNSESGETSDNQTETTDEVSTPDTSDNNESSTEENTDSVEETTETETTEESSEEPVTTPSESEDLSDVEDSVDATTE